MVGGIASTHGLEAENAYLREFEATVLAVEVEGRRVALDRTAFFPGRWRAASRSGLDLQADGGTHVARTGEIGSVSMPEYKSKGRLNKRLQLVLSG